MRRYEALSITKSTLAGRGAIQKRLQQRTPKTSQPSRLEIGKLPVYANDKDSSQLSLLITTRISRIYLISRSKRTIRILQATSLHCLQSPAKVETRTPEVLSNRITIIRTLIDQSESPHLMKPPPLAQASQRNLVPEGRCESS